MQIPILNGIYTDENSDFRTSYPINLVPVPKEQGISKGYLRPADGIISGGSLGPGLCRGAINWNGRHFRVMGTKLCEYFIDGTFTQIGDISGSDNVRFDYSFDYLSISGNNNLYYFDGISTLTQVTDPDLGNVIDHMWVDGYFMATDGTTIIVTELTNPFSVLPTKYGSSEADPDPIMGFAKIKDEPYVINRYTIEIFSNVGGTGFPFSRIAGALLQRGSVGTRMACLFRMNESTGIAFVGSGRNEPVSVFFTIGGSDVSISTMEIDKILKSYGESVLSTMVMESKIDEGHQHLLIHLPDKTLVYDAAASVVMKEPVWFVLSSGLLSVGEYRARDFVWCFDQWWVGDTSTFDVGYLTNESSDHWGETVMWEFGTMIVYNDGMGAIFHELELICLSGRVALSADPRISTSYSIDGETWSMPKYIRSGKQGNRKKRLVWLNQGNMQNIRIQKFNGTSDSHLSMARLEARLEGLSV